jgi:hypothetical protein
VRRDVGESVVRIAKEALIQLRDCFHCNVKIIHSARDGSDRHVTESVVVARRICS